jgi:hypothetical protein
MVIARFSVLAICGVLSTVLDVSQSTNLRAEKGVASEAADDAALMRNVVEEFENERLVEEFENERHLDGPDYYKVEEKEGVASETAEAALMRNLTEELEKERDLQGLGDWEAVIPCDSGWGGQLPYPFNQNPEIWGTCDSMNPCMCGLDSVRFAYMCPSRCRPSCGGGCATNGWGGNCPSGFAIDVYGTKQTLGTSLPAPDSKLWPWNMGMYCTIYDHTGNYSP